MKNRLTRRHSITWRLIQLFIILLILFTGVVGVLYNSRLRRQTLAPPPVQHGAAVAPAASEGLDIQPKPQLPLA